MTSPYADKILHNLVTLEPNQMNTDVYRNLYDNLAYGSANSRGVLGRCIADGFIIKIYEIISYSDGELMMEDFSGKSRHDVTYSARICAPIKGSMIMCSIDVINKAMIKARNGPILVIIQTLQHLSNKFFINQNEELCFKEEKEKCKVIKKGDIVKITIIGKKYSIGSKEIIILGILEDMANDKEKKEFETDYDEKKEGMYINPNMVNKDIDRDDRESDGEFSSDSEQSESEHKSKLNKK